MQNKVAFIVPYYGQLPAYFPLFANSVKDQPFDILFITDIPKPDFIASNILWKQLPFEELRVKFEEKLEISLALNKPYKLCDFKPLYGFLFQEHLGKYDFWGWLDIDTIIGDFGKFVTDEILYTTDIYSGIKEYTAGALVLVRNNEYCNTLFKKSKDWVKVMQNPVYIGFDECGGHFYAQLKAGKTIFELDTLAESFTEIVLSEKTKGLRLHFTDSILEAQGLQPVKVEPLKVTYNSREFVMLHFIYFKVTYYFYIKTAGLPSTYYVSGLGIFKHKPSFLNIFFSRNFWTGVSTKIQRNSSSKSLSSSLMNIGSLLYKGINYTFKRFTPIK